MKNLQSLIKEKIIPEFIKFNYVAIDLEKTDYPLFNQYLHRNNSKFSNNTCYCFETQEDFSGYAIKNKNTGEIKQFKLVFPYSKLDIYLKNDEELYNLGDSKHSIKKKYIFGSVNHFGFFFVLSELLVFIALFLTVNLVHSVENYKFIYSTFFTLFYIVLFYLPFKLGNIPKKQEKKRIEKLDAYINGLTEYKSILKNEIYK